MPRTREEPVPGGGPAAGRRLRVLTDRIAAAVAYHEPGWRLPRHTALARRYNVSTAEIDLALDDLAARHLIRRLPDGQFYRVSPAAELIPLAGVPGLSTVADPMGGQIVCQSRQASLRQVPEDIGWALRVPPASQVGVIRTQWTAYGDPAAFCATYVLHDVAAPFLDASASAETVDDVTAIGRPGSVQLEMRPPPPSLARRLRLAVGQPAALVTTRFDDLEKRRPVALTVAVFRPDLFRIVVQTAGRPLAASGAGSFAGAWADATGEVPHSASPANIQPADRY